MVPTGAKAQGAFAGSSQTKAGMPIGPFGGMASLMSPAASPPQSVTPVPPVTGVDGPAPSGSTPNAKRPMNRAAVDVVVGGARTMSLEDLSAGFANFERVVTRDEAFASDVAGSVQYNADLLNLLITRVNALEVATQLSSEGLQKASDYTAEGFQKSSDFTTELDRKLREHIDLAIAAMKVDFDRLEEIAQAAQPGVEFGKMGKAFDDLQGQLTAVSTRLSEASELLQTQQTAAITRVEALELTSNHVHKDALEKFAVLATKFTELESLYHGSGAGSRPHGRWA